MEGLGGIFFDDFNSEDPEIHLQFAKDCLEAHALKHNEKQKH